MELAKIESLLIKYDEGDTTLVEENILKEYFASTNIPSHLEEYKTIFSYTAKAKNIPFKREVSYESNKRRFAFAGVAASIIIALGIFIAVNNSGEQFDQQNALGTIEDPEEAYLQAKEALLMVSQALNMGREDLTYVEEFDKAKNRYIKE
ncbi:hypothetical protein BH23BAC2_BH23BAC2_15490 [soil metagenome]